MMRKTVLVAGASGVVGRAAIRHFARCDGWDVIGVSRRIPEQVPGARLFNLDLADVEACADLMSRVGADVTHLVFAAQYEAPGLADGWFDAQAIDLNRRMLTNLFEPLAAHATGLEHVSLMQGSKAYGMHDPSLFEQIRVPLRERDPRLEHPNFYFVQQGYLEALQKQGGWGLTVLRPTIIYGDAPGANMNAIRPIAVYAALEREKGRVLHYPGTTYDQPFREAADADLVAAALGWAAGSPGATDGVFNLTNGDTFLWRNVWQAVAKAFDMEAGEHRPMSFAEDLPAREAEWAALVDKYGLAAPRSLVEHIGANSLLYADWMLGGVPGVVAPLNSTIAIRQAGFNGCIDTEDMFHKWFLRVQADGVVPDHRPANSVRTSPALEDVP